MKGKVIKEIVFILVMAMAFCTLTACGSSTGGDETDETDETVTVEVGEFSVPIYSSYKESESSVASSSNSLRMYENILLGSVIAIDSTYARNSSLEGYAEYNKSVILESLDGADADISCENCSLGDMNECCYLTYTYKKAGNDITCCTYLIYSNGFVLSITETRSGNSEEEIKNNIKILAEKVKYIGDFMLPKEDQYPYTVTGDFASVSINEGLICDDASKVENGEATLESSDIISIRLRKADSFYRGAFSRLEIMLSNDQTMSASDKATESYEKRKSKDEFTNLTYDEFTYGKMFPGCPSDMDSITLYKISYSYIAEDMLEESIDIDVFYFEYNGNVYSITMGYIHGDEEVKSAFIDQMKNVTITK